MQNTFFYKLSRFEFWPIYAIYVPLFPVFIYGLMKTRKLLFFTAVNPKIRFGGAFGYKKDELLQDLPAENRIKTWVIEPCTYEDLVKVLIAEEVIFPIIAKPNVGERGEGVMKFSSLEELKKYDTQKEQFLIQEFISYELELGVMYYRYPSQNKIVISSLTEKEYIHVLGNGRMTVKELVLNDARKRIYFSNLVADYPEKLEIVPQMGERFVIHTIGNHAKGTRFLNRNHRISEKLVEVIAELTKEMPDFYFGRFDIKVPNYEALENGIDIKIIELNGVFSEPCHIYDLPSFFHAYKDLAKHWLVIIDISKQNIKKGVKTTPINYFFNQVKNHFA